LAFFAYCTNYLIDLKHAVIMDVEATTAVRQAEVTAQRVMIDRTHRRFGRWPERLTADAGYGSAENLAWLVHERGIEPSRHRRRSRAITRTAQNRLLQHYPLILDLPAVTPEREGSNPNPSFVPWVSSI
jgi:hypothetical protein